jgi:hypothetical protein
MTLPADDAPALVTDPARIAALVAAMPPADLGRTLTRLVVAVQRYRAAARDGIRPFANRSPGWVGAADQIHAAYADLVRAAAAVAGDDPECTPEPK